MLKTILFKDFVNITQFCKILENAKSYVIDHEQAGDRIYLTVHDLSCIEAIFTHWTVNNYFGNASARRHSSRQNENNLPYFSVSYLQLILLN